MFHSILAATDFSPCAERALAVAFAWARKLDARIEIVHVLEHPMQAIPSGAAWVGEDVVSAHERELAGRLEHLVATCADGVVARSLVLRGRPHVAITRRAETTGADLIVIGARGLGAIEATLFGSVADRVVRTTRGSVLVVPEGAHAELVPRAIVLPTDFSAAAAHTVDRTLGLARALGARVEVVHGWERPRAAPRSGGIAEDIAGAVLVSVRSAHPIAAGVPMRHFAREAAPTDAILGVVAETHADLVVMAPSGQRHLASWLLGGVTDRVLRSSPVPVLVLRDAARSTGT